MHHLLARDWAQLDELLAGGSYAAIQYLQGVGRRPAGRATPQASTEVPRLDSPLGAEGTLRLAKEYFDAGLAATTSPRYLGYVTGGVTPAALVGDWLASTYDQNPHGLRAFGDVSGRVEHETVPLLRELLGLHGVFNGGFVTGATVSNYTCLGVARQWAGRQQGYDVAAEGLLQPIPVFSATSHSSVTKALAGLGLGRNAVRKIATLPGREAMDVTDLARKLTDLKGAAAIVIASAGTVNTADFDDFSALLELRKRYSFWLHIDGAFGGFAKLSDSEAHRELLRDWSGADSVTVDNHKWLNVPYDSGTWFVKKQHQELQVATFANGGAAYLNADAGDWNYLNVGPENSRRLRALPIWFTLKAYGRVGYEDIVTRCCATARQLGAALASSAVYALLAPVRLNVVAFTAPELAAEEIDALAQLLNDRGKFFLTPTTLFGRRGLRAAFVNWQHDPRQVEALMTELDACYALISSATTAGAAHLHNTAL